MYIFKKVVFFIQLTSLLIANRPFGRVICDISDKYDDISLIESWMLKNPLSPLWFFPQLGFRMGSECERLNKRLAVLISEKTKERYNHVVSHIRTKLRFSLLKAIVIAIHGYRGKQNTLEQENSELPVSEISFNLIPESPRLN